MQVTNVRTTVVGTPWRDLVFVALTVVAVNLLHLSVPVALLGVGALAILWYRPQ